MLSGKQFNRAQPIIRWILLTVLAGAALLGSASIPGFTQSPAVSQSYRPVDSVETVVLPKASARVRRYEDLQYAVGFGSLAYSFLLLWGLMETGAAVRLRRVAERISRRNSVILTVTLILLTTVTFVLILPLAYYGEFVLPHAFGLSTQSVFSWLRDHNLGHAINTVIYLVVFCGLFFLVRRSPTKWPIWCWLAGIPVIACAIYAQPLIIDPLFNHFKPLPAGPLRTQIAALEDRAGIPGAPIYVVDMSKKSREVNAYVTGFGGSSRIVLWDSTIQELPQDQVLAMVGHETGHYVRHHVRRGFLEALVITAFLLPLYRWMLHTLLRLRGTRWGMTGLTDPAFIPAWLLCAALLTFLTAPLSSALSRQMESEADAFGISITGNPFAMARMFVSVSRIDLSDPDPPSIIQFFYGDHPTLRQRVDRALSDSSTY